MCKYSRLYIRKISPFGEDKTSIKIGVIEFGGLAKSPKIESRLYSILKPRVDWG
jgi:hypothetical protein